MIQVSAGGSKEFDPFFAAFVGAVPSKGPEIDCKLQSISSYLMRRITLAAVAVLVSAAAGAHNGDVVFVSPDGKLRAMQIATSDGCADKISIRDAHDHELNVRHHNSSNGENGRYLFRADWTPDSLFFVYSTFSSGAHSIWHWETFAYDVHRNRFFELDDFVGPIVESEITLGPPHQFRSKRLNPQGGVDAPAMPIDVDLAQVLGNR
jgi:hypothetical protein